ncbi:sporulation protein YunB [Anoxybacter fermentans]|uniref:Sporulation protein YunB n=1 Tax=Anoxybacter fermentans TaxID=1323375 RepID=A0A3S9SZD2_9FIRM|nr:sporulation protein YunB [Anoxybacter fermentans]AZR73657.1 sporulation protein YunB [Anoxybacter fermentans]
MYRPYWNKTGHRLFKFIIIIFLISGFLGAAVTLMIESFLRPIFLAIAEEKAVQMVTDAISRSVYQHARTLQYTDLIHYQTNHQGDIILMQPNLQLVNEFISEVNMTIQQNLKKLRETEIRIPIAQALGIQVLAALGPSLSVQMVPIGIVRPPQILDTFETAGINQTRHKIYMHVIAEVRIVVPFLHKKIQVNTQVPVTEVTIMGKVPEVYVGIDGGIIRWE